MSEKKKESVKINKNIEFAKMYLNQHSGFDGIEINDIDFNERNYLLDFVSEYPKWLKNKTVHNESLFDLVMT